MHDWHRPLDHLVVIAQWHNATRQFHTAVSPRHYASCILVTLMFWLNIHWWRGIVVNCPCAKFGHLGLSRFDFIVRTDTQTTVRITEADDHYTDVWVIMMVMMMINSNCNLNPWEWMLTSDIPVLKIISVLVSIKFFRNNFSSVSVSVFTCLLYTSPSPRD